MKEKLTKEERTEIALEEYKAQKFQLISVVSCGQAAQLMVDTNATELKVSTEVTINGKRYKVDSIYSITNLLEQKGK